MTLNKVQLYHGDLFEHVLYIPYQNVRTLELLLDY